ncbi:hypothetical protein BD770DRAFT_390822 [Pilaira anomala]|nr:hypothetical protein BD770DRAFT_390822 [Pilaira anomala]
MSKENKFNLDFLFITLFFFYYNNYLKKVTSALAFTIRKEKVSESKFPKTNHEEVH